MALNPEFHMQIPAAGHLTGREAGAHNHIKEGATSAPTLAIQHQAPAVVSKANISRRAEPGPFQALPGLELPEIAAASCQSLLIGASRTCISATSHKLALEPIFLCESHSYAIMALSFH